MPMGYRCNTDGVVNSSIVLPPPCKQLPTPARPSQFAPDGPPGLVSDLGACGMESGMGTEALRVWDAACRRLQGRSRELAATSRRGRRRAPESRRFGPKRGGVSRAACGRYAHGTADCEVVLHAERLRCCATRPLREGGELMLGYEEKLERIELIDAVCDAGRLARGLDQLLEFLAHADQLDPLDVEGILALRSISERCSERIATPHASWRCRTRSSMPRNATATSSMPRFRQRAIKRRGTKTPNDADARRFPRFMHSELMPLNAIFRT